MTRATLRSVGNACAVLILASAAPACRSHGAGLETPAELPNDTYYHALPQTQLGVYAVLLPPGYHSPENGKRVYPLVLIIHGHGSNEIRHGQLADVFGRDDVIYLAPRAPYPHEEVFMYLDTPGWTAWPRVPEQLRAVDEGDEDYVDVEKLYTTWIADTVSDVRRRYRVSEQRVVVYGHSQGAYFSHLLALHHPELVKAYFAFAGGYGQTTEKPSSRAASILLENEIFPFVAHNRPDPMVPAVESERLVSYFEEYGVRHGSFISESGDHYLTDEGERRAKEFLRDWCCGPHGNERRKLPALKARSEPDDARNVDTTATAVDASEPAAVECVPPADVE